MNQVKFKNTREPYLTVLQSVVFFFTLIGLTFLIAFILRYIV